MAPVNDNKNSKKKFNKKKQQNGDKTALITDERFSAVHSDPRFQNVSKRKSKVAIDSRFDCMFTDKNFASSSAKLDKRGKAKKSKPGETLKRYYRIDNEDGNEGDAREPKRVEKEEESEKELVKVGGSESEEEEESENGLVKVGGSESEEEEEGSETGGSESELESGAESESNTDTDEGEDMEDDVEYEYQLQEDNVPTIEKETHRLAIVNLDWSNVSATDLYVVLSSFLPSVGQILSVTVYPSEYGVQRMKEEDVNGPVGLFDDEKNKDDEDDEEDNDDEIDDEKLRAYERSRLRYYYAVVECDSVATADYLYKSCDGVEFERSSNLLDLRFIPDSMEFKHPPRDVCNEAPTNYEGLDFQTRVLQHSNIQLTWDEDEPHRVKSLNRKFNDDQLADLELKEFLASDESESESDDDEDDEPSADKPERKRDVQDKYRALLQSGNGSDEGNEEGDQDMEVTFNTGLEDLSKRILEKKDKKQETVWEAHLRKQREKKRARKNKSKYSSDDDSSGTDTEPIEQADDFFIEEPSAKRSKKDKQGKSNRSGKKHQDTDGEAEASKAELELLLADDKGMDADLKGYNLKRKKNKGKKGKEILEEDKIPTVDYSDPRFSALFTSPNFALDPTDPQFKRSAAYARQVAQKQRKHEREPFEDKTQTNMPAQEELPSDLPGSNKDDDTNINALSSKKEKYELSSLVRSVKNKTKQIQLGPVRKTLKKDKKQQSGSKRS